MRCAEVRLIAAVSTQLGWLTSFLPRLLNRLLAAQLLVPHRWYSLPTASYAAGCDAASGCVAGCLASELHSKLYTVSAICSAH